MECSFALTGKGFSIVASDSIAARSIVKMKHDEDKMKEISKHLVMAYSGEPGDTVQFAEYVERNLRLYETRNHIELRPRAAASWIRNQLAESIRSRKPYAVNLLLAGFDGPSSTPSVYWVDYLGTMATVPYAAHGYGAYFALSTMDRYHRPDMSEEEGMELMRRCIDEVRKRLLVDTGRWKVRIIDQNGVRLAEL